MTSAVKDKDAGAKKISGTEHPNETGKKPKRSRFWLIAFATVLALATASGAFLWVRRWFSATEL
ncbi:MAG TPA: hypothetical protein VFK47_05325 [Ktedonobacteraceae bacterium]|nr:hypothetical protein [Ktedonobacteraceae bacterium]